MDFITCKLDNEWGQYRDEGTRFTDIDRDPGDTRVRCMDQLSGYVD